MACAAVFFLDRTEATFEVAAFNLAAAFEAADAVDVTAFLAAAVFDTRAFSSFAFNCASSFSRATTGSVGLRPAIRVTLFYTLMKVVAPHYEITRKIQVFFNDFRCFRRFFLKKC